MSIKRAAIDEETRQRIESLYGTGSSGALRQAGRSSLIGAALGALGLGIPAAALLFGSRYALLRKIPKSNLRDDLSLLTGAGAAAGTGYAAYKGVIPGAATAGILGAFDPSAARKELYNIARGHGDYTKAEQRLAQKALKDIAGQATTPGM